MKGPIDLRAVRNRHKRFEDLLSRTVNTALEESGAMAVRHIREKSGFGKGPAAPGSLRASGRAVLVKVGAVRVLRVSATRIKRQSGSVNDIAPFLEFGAKPHIISARVKRWLRFRGRNGRWVVTKFIRHPGTTAYRFISRARDRAAWAFRLKMLSRLPKYI